MGLSKHEHIRCFNLILKKWGIVWYILLCKIICRKHIIVDIYFVPLQKKRLKECEKLFVAIEIAGWLNDYQLCLQAIVQCYGLLVPLLYHQVAIIPVAQVGLTSGEIYMSPLPIHLLFEQSVSCPFFYYSFAKKNT